MLYINYPSWLRPEIIDGLPFRWYGLMYIVAFAIAYYLFKLQLKNNTTVKINNKQAEDLFFAGIVGLLLGARLFYVIFYNPAEYLANPLSIIWPFSNGQFVGIQGISYHGGVIGAIIAVIIYCKKHQLNMLRVSDLIAPGIPLGYTFGRLGNFFNAELYGKVSANPLAMLFPDADPVPAFEPWARAIADKTAIDIGSNFFINLPRHPSQLYEALFEGVILFLVLWFVVRPRNKTAGGMLAAYLIGYGLVRFFIEYLREPDVQLGFIIRGGAGADTPQVFTSLLNFSMGQVLCVLMIVAGVSLYFISRHLERVTR